MSKDKMKLSVLMFCRQFRPIIGGAERETEKLGAALVEAGCRVKVLTPRFDPDSPDMEKLDGLTVERFPLSDLSRRYPVYESPRSRQYLLASTLVRLARISSLD
jgi:Glycosyl transferase 4-like domain